jgi:hypothetical protein
MDEQKLSFNNWPGFAALALIPCMFVVLGISIASGLTGRKPEPLGLIFTAAGLLFLSMASYKSLTLYRIGRKITGTTRSIISGKTVVVDFSDVTSVEFRWERSQGRKRRQIGVLAFKRADGQEALFAEVVNNENDAKKVAEFIGVPFSYKPPASLFEKIGEVQEMMSGVRQTPPKQDTKNV